jgi:hypothetical protein
MALLLKETALGFLSAAMYKACSKKDRTFAIKITCSFYSILSTVPFTVVPSKGVFFHCWNASWNALSVMARSSLIAFSRISSMSLIRRIACALAQFRGCSSTTNVHDETGQMAVFCQNLTLGALSSRGALSMLVGALFEKFGLFLNTPSTFRKNI